MRKAEGRRGQPSAFFGGMMKPIGLYIHVPFCDGKCPYCDFYSLRGDGGLMDQYTKSIIEYIKYYSERLNRPADTLYFGGGTPGLLGAERLLRMVSAAKEGFLLENAEITVEVNPAREQGELFQRLFQGGVNRLSIGLQSADEEELRLLGRRHTALQAAEAVDAAGKAGFRNISLDLMLAIQRQTKESLRRSIQFCGEAGARHVSAYLLKVEEGTPYSRQNLALPGEDETAERYLFACEELERLGFMQYEISNFAQPGFESRHNLKYWHDEEYLGLGPAAHSFLEGRRFYFPRDLEGFLRGKPPESDGGGGDLEEYAMMNLRLREGLTETGCRSRFGTGIPAQYRARAARFTEADLLICDDGGIRFTRKGFLVSNSLMGEILFG